MVVVAVSSKTDLSAKLIVCENRISRYTPAVTSVDEWTSAETGVGAAIAAGSHAENGICALLVNAPIIINLVIIVLCRGSDQNLHAIIL